MSPEGQAGRGGDDNAGEGIQIAHGRRARQSAAGELRSYAGRLPTPVISGQGSGFLPQDPGVGAFGGGHARDGSRTCHVLPRHVGIPEALQRKDGQVGPRHRADHRVVLRELRLARGRRAVRIEARVADDGERHAARAHDVLAHALVLQPVEKAGHLLPPQVPELLRVRVRRPRRRDGSAARRPRPSRARSARAGTSRRSGDRHSRPARRR